MSRADPTRVLRSPDASSPAVRAVMRGNRGTDTTPEIRLRSALHKKGARFRKDYAVVANGVRVRGDIVFPRQRVVVFVDGCFWHGCPEHGTTPRTNSDYWSVKLKRNRDRDDRSSTALQRAGWKVVRVWEHEDPNVAVGRVLAALL